MWQAHGDRRDAAAFARILQSMGVPLDEEGLTRAIAFSGFEALRGQEHAGGFIEHSGSKAAFFRVGQAGSGTTAPALRKRTP